MSPVVVAGLVAAAVLLCATPSRTWPARRPGVASRPTTWSLPGARRLVAARRSGRSGTTRAAALLEAVAAELRAGRATGVALQRAAAADPTLVPHAVGALRLGGDVPRALELDAQVQHLPVLRRFAACWRVGAGTGAGLATAVDRLAASTRDSERVRLELRARTAEPRATMRVLAALPLAGVALGALLGADTVGWLLGSVPGRVVLAAGLALDLAGLLWARWLVSGLDGQL